MNPRTTRWEAFRADDSGASPVEGLRGYSYVVLKVLQGRRERDRGKGKIRKKGNLIRRWKPTGNWTRGSSDVVKENTAVLKWELLKQSSNGMRQMCSCVDKNFSMLNLKEIKACHLQRFNMFFVCVSPSCTIICSTNFKCHWKHIVLSWKKKMFPFNRKPVLRVLIVYAQDIKPAVCILYMYIYIRKQRMANLIHLGGKFRSFRYSI